MKPAYNKSFKPQGKNPPCSDAAKNRGAV